MAVELLDHLGEVRIILFDGQTHPECLPSGGKPPARGYEDPVKEAVTANVYPKELYADAALIDYEPIATRVSLDEAIRVIRED